MEETIKDIEVIAYKGMESNMACRGFQYELGKTYKTDKAELCKYGFHACLNPRYVLDYYEQGEGSRYFKVKLSGEIAKCDNLDTKVAATEITILEEINIDEVIKTTEWWKTENVLDLLYYSEGFTIIQRGDYLFNFIDKQGTILSKEWFDWVIDFNEGVARVESVDNLYNFIDVQGKYLFNKWFNYLGDFFDGLATVEREDGLWNSIDKNANYLYKEWFKYLDEFYEGFAVVQREDNLYNFIDKEGNYLSKEWFVYVYSFHKGFAEVQRTNGKWGKIDKTGKILKS